MRASSVTRTTAALLLVLVSGCGSTRESGEPDSSRVVFAAPTELDDAQLRGVFQDLVNALDAHADEEARRIVARLDTLALDEVSRRRLEGCKRILFGRQVVGDTQLELEAELADGQVKVSVAVTAPDVDCVLRPGAPALRLQRTTMFPSGEEDRFVTTRLAPELERLELRRGSESTLELGTFELAIGRGLASRLRFDLDLGGGVVEVDGQDYPAMHYSIQPCEVVRLASFLPSAAVEPSELARYVSVSRIRRAALVERAVRIAPSRRNEALDLLAPIVVELDRVRIEEIVPALRWLGGNVRFGADPQAWRTWFETRAELLAVPLRPELDLPNR